MQENKNSSPAAKGIAINALNVSAFLQFFCSLFPRQLDRIRCFPVLHIIDTDSYFVKPSYHPNEQTKRMGAGSLMLWNSNGGIRAPLNAEWLELMSAIQKDRISIGYCNGTRLNGENIVEIYTGLPLTDVTLPAPNQQPLFSILMPVYNRELTVARAIKSIQESLFSDFECIIVDDGSTDNTSSVIDQAIEKDARFKKIVKDTNTGIGSSLAVGALNSFGMWLTRCDSDDEYLPNHLTLRVEYIAKNPDTTVIYGGMSPINGTDTIPLKSGIVLPIERTAQGPTIFFKRDVLDRIGTFSDMRYGEDEDFINRARNGNENILQVSDKTYLYYRDSVNSLTRNYSKLVCASDLTRETE